MRLSGTIRQIMWLSATLAGLALVVTATSAQTTGKPERFTALAVNMGTPGPTGAATVDIAVTRWSTEAERDRLLTVLMEQGPEKLLSALQRLPKAGYIKTPNSLGYDLHFARKTPLPDGGERVVLATDRYVSFWEAANHTRSMDYPFTLIEMHLNANGEGEGKMSLATKIIADKENKQIVLENYASQPVLLTTVRKEPSR